MPPKKPRPGAPGKREKAACLLFTSSHQTHDSYLQVLPSPWLWKEWEQTREYMSFAYDRCVDVVGTHATPQNIRQRNTYAAATPRQRKVRSLYAVHTPRYAIEANYTPFIHTWYAMTTLYTLYIRHSYTSRVPMAYQAITLRSLSVTAAFFSLLRRTCDVYIAYQSTCGEFFRADLKNRRTIAYKDIVLRISYASFRYCGVPFLLTRIGIRRTYASWYANVWLRS